jgi:prevent-host-death family protein
MRASMTRTWTFEEAQERLDEIVDAAIRDGPQVITRDGVETVVILSLADYQKLTSNP